MPLLRRRLRALADARAASRRDAPRHHRWRGRWVHAEAENVLGRAGGLPLHDLEHELLEADALMAALPGLPRARRLSGRLPAGRRVRAERAGHRRAGRARARRWRGPSRARGRPRLAARRRRRGGANRSRYLSGASPGHQRRRVGCAACSPRWPASPSRSGRSCCGPGRCGRSTSPSAPSRSSSSTSPRAASTASRSTASRASSWASTTTAARSSTRTRGTVSGALRAGGRGSPAGLHEPLLPGRRRADPDAEDLHLHEHARRALHHRSAATRRRRSSSSRPAAATASSSPR